VSQLHEFEIILTLTGGLSAALVFGFIANKMGVSPIVGYLLAGIVVGPHTPGFIADKTVASQFAEVGVILLMFGVGLRFHIKDLFRVARIAVPGAILEIAAATTYGFLVTGFFGWPPHSGIIFGITVSVASTVVLTRVLAENRTIHTPDGHIAVGWLVVEDIFTVLVLVLLPILFPPEPARIQGWEGTIPIGIAFIKLSLLFIVVFIFGNRIITAILGYVSRMRSRELFTLSVLVLALGIAVGSSLLFGASMALGALLAGMVVGQSDYSTRAASEALPMRDAFSVLFFVSMGMMFDPASLLASWPLILSVLGIVLVLKPLSAMIIMTLLGRPFSSALPISIALSQIGEFSFILASLGVGMKLIPQESINILVVVSMVTISLNPTLYKKIALLSASLVAWKRSRALEKETRIVPDTLASKMILIGYGPVGRTLHRILTDNGIHVTVVEMNLETVKSLRENGISVVYGDALKRETLLAAGAEEAQGLIVSTPDLPGKELIQTAKDTNPKLQVLFRSNYLRDVNEMKLTGADAVFSGEGEIALAMSAFLMKALGSTDEQIDHERERVRKELFNR
jgi:CPA2 family monovalent cation:H+ antiporter-2